MMSLVKRDRFLVRLWDDLLLPMFSRRCTYIQKREGVRKFRQKGEGRIL